MTQKITRLGASCKTPSRSSGMVSRTWLKDSWDALRQILPQGWKAIFVTYSCSSVTVRQTKMWRMSQWWWVDAVAQSFQALRYKLKVCKCDSRWGIGIFY